MKFFNINCWFDRKNNLTQLQKNSVFITFQVKLTLLMYFFFWIGAHTIGFSHCSKFSKRIYNFNPKSRIDPTLNRNYVFQLRQMCPLRVDSRIAINMDPTTPQTFDNAYYKNLQQGRGLFVSDQVLFSDQRSRGTVNLFASNNTAFIKAFVIAITKLGRVGVKTGRQGEIRIDCTRPN